MERQSWEDDSSELPLMAHELEKGNRQQSRTVLGKNTTVQTRRLCDRSSKHPFSSVPLTAISTFLLTVALMLCLRSLEHHYQQRQPFIYDSFFDRSRPGTISCGNTTDEAIARGCRFDELADLWLPEKCSRSFETAYLKTNNGGPFIYWADTAGKHQLNNRSMYVGGNTYYSTTRDHLVHCEYNLYRFAQSLKTGEPIGHGGGFAEHMHHCAHMLGMFANKAPGIDAIDVTTESGFGYC